MSNVEQSRQLAVRGTADTCASASRQGSVRFHDHQVPLGSCHHVSSQIPRGTQSVSVVSHKEHGVRTSAELSSAVSVCSVVSAGRHIPPGACLHWSPIWPLYGLSVMRLASQLYASCSIPPTCGSSSSGDSHTSRPLRPLAACTTCELEILHLHPRIPSRACRGCVVGCVSRRVFGWTELAS